MIMIVFRVLVHGLSMALVPLSIVVLAFASAADAPVQLGNDHIGMTSESMAQADGESRDEARVEAAPAENEWHSEAPVTGAAPSAVAHDGPAAHNYEDCVELAIRSGNGFRASSSVCQALFLGGFTPALSQRPAPIASEDDGLLLLTLPPSTLEAEPEAEPGDEATATEEMAEQTAPTEAEETVTPTEVTEAAAVATPTEVTELTEAEAAATPTEAPEQPADETEQAVTPTEAPEEPATPSEAEAGAGDVSVVPDEATVAPSEASAEMPTDG